MQSYMNVRLVFWDDICHKNLWEEGYMTTKIKRYVPVQSDKENVY